jgi:hypothetical protein
MKLSKTGATWLLCAVMASIMAVPAKARSVQPDIVVTEQDNGKDITLHGSQRLIIRLPSTGPYSWSPLMRPDAQLAFTKAPAPEEKKKNGDAMPMVGGSHDQVFAFRAAEFTESSSQWFQLLFCRAPCDLKDPSAKIFKLGITTQKK